MAAFVADDFSGTHSEGFDTKLYIKSTNATNKTAIEFSGCDLRFAPLLHQILVASPSADRADINSISPPLHLSYISSNT